MTGKKKLPMSDKKKKKKENIERKVRDKGHMRWCF